MSVTQNEIARAAGVSRGTVDRALNNRGRIKPEVADKIKKIAEEMGYSINVSGRALAMSARHNVIGVIIQFAETPFMQEILAGIEAASEEINRMGCLVQIHKIKGLDTDQAVSLMREMCLDQVSAIILVGSDDTALKREIETCRIANVPVITLNSDIRDSSRKYFVGQNAARAGRTAAGVMGDILGGTGKVCVFYGLENTLQGERARAFRKTIEEDFPGVSIVEEKRTANNISKLRKMTEQLLKEHPDLAGIYLCAEGKNEICEYLKKTGRSGSLRLLVHDVAGCRPEYILDRTIDYVIDDDGYGQGYQALHLLFLWNYYQKEPLDEYYYVDIRILNRYNLPVAEALPAASPES